MIASCLFKLRNQHPTSIIDHKSSTKTLNVSTYNPLESKGIGIDKSMTINDATNSIKSTTSSTSASLFSKIKRNFDELDTDISIQLKKIQNRNNIIRSRLEEASKSSSSGSSPINKSEFVDLNLSSNVADYKTYVLPNSIEILESKNQDEDSIIHTDQLSDISMTSDKS